MFKPTYLYIKTHNKTGLKYFGKTISKRPHTYKGSGVKWKKHIEEFGYDVTTEILGFYLDEQECKDIALRFSRENNIVKSNDWANLKEETIDNGWDKEISIKNSPFVNPEKYGKEKVDGWRNKAKEKIKEYHKNTNTSLLKKEEWMSGKNKGFSGKKFTKEQTEKRKQSYKDISHQQGKKNSQFGTMWIYNLETKENKKIRKEDPIPENWIKGRKLKFDFR